MRVPNGARTRNLMIHNQALCRLSYRHRELLEIEKSKPSSVLDGHLSRPLAGPATSSPSWRLSTFGLGEQPDNGRIGDCCGEDCPFHSRLCRHWRAFVAVALAHGDRERQSGLSTCFHDSLAFTRHPCSVQLGLSSRPKASDHPFSLQSSSVVKVRTRHYGEPVCGDFLAKPPTKWCRRGDLNSHGVTPTTT